MTNHPPSKSHPLIPCLVYLALIAIIYFLSLRFFFPGYFHPLTPHHTDAFDYPFIFQSYSFTDFLSATRPVGDVIITHLFGGISYQWTIICFIALNFLSLLLLLTLIQKIYPQKIPLPLTAIFFLLLFTHPGFYLHYTYDVYSVLAFFFILLSFLTYYTQSKLKLPLIFLLLFLSGFCKETYLISALVFFAAQFFLRPKTNRRQYFTLVLGTIFVTIIVLLRNKLSGSHFNALSPDITTPYYTNFHPLSIITTLTYYLKNFMSPPLLILSLISIIYLIKKKLFKNLIIFLTFFLAGLAAYLPYSLLPNHTLPYYFYVAVPLAYASFLTLPLSKIFTPRPNLPLVIVTLLIIAHFIFLFARPYQTYQNYLRDEKITHNLLLSLPLIKQNSYPHQKILILGLENYVWSPFQTRTFFTQYFPDYPVEISYVQNKLWHRNSYTLEITPAQAQEKITQNYYDLIYHYDSNGYLLSVTKGAP
jgi:hypothetical protein